MKHYSKFFILASSILLIWGATQANTIDVSCTGTLNTAITNANPGDTINNTCASRAETVTVNKAVILEWNGNTIDAGGITWTIISIETGNVIVNNFNLSNIIGFAISTKNAWNVGLSNIHITNNTISNIQAYSKKRESGIGIFLGYMSWYFVYENGNLLQSGLVAELDYPGLIVDNNTISDVAEGIAIQSIRGSAGAELQFTNNNISNTTAWANGGAFYIDSSSYLKIDHNTSDNAYYGINMSSYYFDTPWVTYYSTGGSNNISITNNEFTNAKSAGKRYDGAGITIYGGQVSTMLISGNNLSNNAQYGLLLANNDSLNAWYNYRGENSATVLAKSAINRKRVPFDTAWATINKDPYYYTRSKIRTASGSVTTGDNFATISYTMQEILSDTTRINWTITIGTGSNTSGLASTGLVYGSNIYDGTLWYSGSSTFNNLKAGDYSYEINYITSEGTGTTVTGSFTIPLVAYGCVDSFNEAAIYFNTNIVNVDMLSPTDEADLFSTPEWRAYPWLSTTFYFEYLGSNNPQTLYVDNTFPTCNWY